MYCLFFKELSLIPQNLANLTNIKKRKKIHITLKAGGKSNRAKHMRVEN